MFLIALLRARGLLRTVASFMELTMAKHEFAIISGSSNDSTMTSRDKLLKSAGDLFSTKGFREVSVREIAAHAGVNSALVGYYFRGKQALFNEVYRNHAAPLAKMRMRMLAEASRGGAKPSVEAVLRAWILPWLKAGDDETDPGRTAANRINMDLRFTANLSSERWLNSHKAAPFIQRTHTAFVGALQDALPQLSRKTIIWRLHFVIGAITFGLRCPGPLRALSKGECDPEDLDALMEQALPFAIAGFLAPEPDGNAASQ